MASIVPTLSDSGSAAEDIASKIQQLIVSRDLEAGARLPSERDLAQALQTSRPTVSQAIRILVTKGLVESRRGSGAYVTRRPEDGLAASVDLMLELNQSSVQHLADLRLWLETMSITRAIEECLEEEIVECELALQQLRDSAGDTAAWMSADTNFHAAVARASHNPYLASLFESVHATLINYEYRTWIQEETTPRWLRSTEVSAMAALHDPIVAAMRNRDEEAGKVAVLHHHYVMSQHLAAASHP
ncbi:GntR family transcriptional regulator [Microbacterium sp. MYb62]|nr:GntR family transcriptional regulator [Microbacterium sp. MYb62]